MGWNTGYTIYEETVVGAYGTGELTPAVLRAMLTPYHGTDIDHGGCGDLTSADGLSADEIVLKMLNPDLFEKYLALGGADNDDACDLLQAVYYAEVEGDETWLQRLDGNVKGGDADS